MYVSCITVGTDIDDPCGNNSCSGELICHTNTSLCVCPPDTVRIGDSCCKYLITIKIFLTGIPSFDKNDTCSTSVEKIC